LLQLAGRPACADGTGVTPGRVCRRHPLQSPFRKGWGFFFMGRWYWGYTRESVACPPTGGSPPFIKPLPKRLGLFFCDKSNGMALIFVIPW